MKKIVAAALALAGLSTMALGQPDYDRNLEKAVMAIVAAKIGDLRGGFAADQKPAFVARATEGPASSDSGRGQDFATAASGSFRTASDPARRRAGALAFAQASRQ